MSVSADFRADEPIFGRIGPIFGRMGQFFGRIRVDWADFRAGEPIFGRIECLGALRWVREKDEEDEDEGEEGWDELVHFLHFLSSFVSPPFFPRQRHVRRTFQDWCCLFSK